MAVSNNYVPTKTLGNGSTDIFTASWNLIAESYLKVYSEAVSTGVQTELTEGVDFDLVSFDATGLSITFAPYTTPTSSEYIIIAREISQDQNTPYRTSTGFQGAVLEQSFDKITSMIQDQQDALNRSLKQAVGSTSTNVSLPSTPIDGYGIVWQGTDGTMRNTTSSLADLETNAAIVSTNIANVNAVGGSIANVNAVAGDAADIGVCAANIGDINTCAGDIVAIQGASANASSASTSASNAATSESNAATSEANAAASAAKLVGTSTTSLAIGTGSKVFTTQSGKQFNIGQFVTIVSDANPTTHYMTGQITGYTGTTLTVDVDGVGGTGTRADWTIYVAGKSGSDGVSTSAIQFTIDGGGAAITTGIKGYITVPFNATITGVKLLADQSGSIIVDIWKDTYANYPPTDADTITASAVPTISSSNKSNDQTLTGWTTALTAGDVLGFNVDSATTLERVTVVLEVQR